LILFKSPPEDLDGSGIVSGSNGVNCLSSLKKQSIYWGFFLVVQGIDQGACMNLVVFFSLF
jgi:hypothetical protein